MEAIAEFPLGTPVAFSHVADPQWTPGQWRAQEHEDNYDSDEEPVQENTLRVYNEAMAQIAALSDLKVIEPLTFRLQTEWEVATKREKVLCEEMLNEACPICKVIAPNACEQLLKAFKRSLSTDTELGALTTAYKHAPTKNLKTQILSIYAFQYSSEELKTIHAPFEKLSDRQIKKARAHAKAVGAGMAVEKKTFHRVIIDMTKLNHFLSYIDQPYFYQDVAYGIRKIKLESGEQLVMPNVVRTVGKSTMIELYLKKCRDEEFQPLATSTLYRILKAREASQRKSLQGLDNIAASGADGFETMQKVVEILEQVGANPDWCDNVKKNLKSGKRYLKTEYRAHCRDDTSPCADHCRQHALSDMKCSELQKLCDHEHCVTCDNCEALKATLLSILTQIQSPELDFYSEEQQKDLLYDARQARDTILQWKAHILRAENQDMAKKDVLKSLPLDTVFVLMDWAMKFTQMKYREKQSEWYGKRGMSWHVSCVVSKPSTTDEFDAGVTGRKADPTQVSQDMRKARNDDGSRKFTREEWLTKVQIKSFFSRLSASRRKQQAIQEDDNDDDVVEEELEFEEEEICDEQMKDLLSQLGVEHPITYDGYDICAYVKSDSLSRFNCKILKSICEHFELPYKSRDTKATLLGKIGDMVKDCSC